MGLVGGAMFLLSPLEGSRPPGSSPKAPRTDPMASIWRCSSMTAMDDSRMKKANRIIIREVNIINPTLLVSQSGFSSSLRRGMNPDSLEDRGSQVGR